jgi:hypothetical protein
VETYMRIVKKVTIAVAAALMAIGLLGSPASADSSWGGCCGFSVND